MASIAEYLQAIMNARYGKDVRQSIHDAIDAINTQEEGHVSVIEGYTEDAEAWAKGTKDGTPVESTDPTYHNNAKYYAESIGDTALISEQYAKGTKDGTPVVDGETGYHDNSKYYSEQASGSAQAALEQAQAAAQAAASISGALKPMGTVTFANLPSVSTANTGDMYNISTDFTTTSDFVEGAGHDYTKGTNVYLTANDKWDILTGLPIQYIGTRAEINAAVTAGIITEGMMIYCTDEEGPTDITALMVGYDGTASGSSETSVQGELDKLENDLSGKADASALTDYTVVASVTADGVKTYGALLYELALLMGSDKKKTVLCVQSSSTSFEFYELRRITSNNAAYTTSEVGGDHNLYSFSIQVDVREGYSSFNQLVGSNFTSLTSTVPSSGFVISILR